MEEKEQGKPVMAKDLLLVLEHIEDILVPIQIQMEEMKDSINNIEASIASILEGLK